MSFEGSKGVEVSSIWETLQVERSSGLEIIPIGSMNEASEMTEVEISWLWDYYKFPDNFHVHAPRLEDRVTSSSVDRLAVYEEFLRVGLRFPLHPFIANVLDLYLVVSAQLAPNSF